MRSRLALITSLFFVLANAGPTASQTEQLQVAMPDAQKIVLLARTTLLTLNDAIQTGNYTVLRDIGAPRFRQANTAAQLAQAFSNLASRNIDLSVVSVITPQLKEQPRLDQKEKMLHMKGYFPGERMRLNFELLYQAVDGRWRLFGLSVQPDDTEASQTSSSAGGAERKIGILRHFAPRPRQLNKVRLRWTSAIFASMATVLRQPVLRRNLVS